MIPKILVLACYQRATKIRALQSRFSSVISNVYQNAGIEKDDDSRHSLEKHAKKDEIRRFSNKKFDSGHDVQ